MRIEFWRRATLVGVCLSPALLALACSSSGAGGLSSDAGPTDSTAGDSAGGDAAVGEGGSDGGGDDADSGAVADGSSDSGLGGDAQDGEAGPPASPHRIFITSTSYTADLVSAANALIADAGVAGPDGGRFGPTQARQAADAICQWHADSARLPGTYEVILYSGGTSTFTSLTDADGPWALVDGTPVADSVADLVAGNLRASVDETELGTPHPFVDPSSAYEWEGFKNGGYDCEQWTSASATDLDGAANVGLVGQYRTIYPWQGGASLACDMTAPLHCLQVGTGGGPNVLPTPAVGSKRVFVVQGPYPGNFISLADGGIPDAGTDAVHAQSDQICAAAATSAGFGGTFRAFISSSGTSADAYFAAHGMNGPWVRPDGFAVAANRAALTGTGALSAQIVLQADGTFASGFMVAWTGTQSDGTTGTNCSNFSTTGATLVNMGSLAWKDLTGFYGTTYCNQEGKLLCFEQ